MFENRSLRKRIGGFAAVLLLRCMHAIVGYGRVISARDGQPRVANRGLIGGGVS